MIAGGMAYGFELEDALPGDRAPASATPMPSSRARKARKGLWPAWLGDQ